MSGSDPKCLEIKDVTWRKCTPSKRRRQCECLMYRRDPKSPLNGYSRVHSGCSHCEQKESKIKQSNENRCPYKKGFHCLISSVSCSHYCCAVTSNDPTFSAF